MDGWVTLCIVRWGTFCGTASAFATVADFSEGDGGFGGCLHSCCFGFFVCFSHCCTGVRSFCLCLSRLSRSVAPSAPPLNTLAPAGRAAGSGPFFVAASTRHVDGHPNDPSCQTTRKTRRVRWNTTISLTALWTSAAGRSESVSSEVDQLCFGRRRRRSVDAVRPVKDRSNRSGDAKCHRGTPADGGSLESSLPAEPGAGQHCKANARRPSPLPAVAKLHNLCPALGM